MRRPGPDSAPTYLHRVWRYLVALGVLAILDGWLGSMTGTWPLILQALDIVLLLVTLGFLVQMARRKP